MGVNVSSMCFIGKWVADAEAYLVEKGYLEVGELEEKFYDDFGCAELPLQVQEVSYYSDEGAYVGFEVSASSYKDFDGLLDKFKQLTGEDGEVCQFSQWW